MNDQWYYNRDGQSVGPFSMPELATLAKAGAISPRTILFSCGGQRASADKVIDFGLEPATTPASAMAGGSMPPPPPDAPARGVVSSRMDILPAGAFGSVSPPPPPDAQTLRPLDGRSACPSASPTLAAGTIAQTEWARLREIAYWHRWLNLAVAAAALLDLMGGTPVIFLGVSLVCVWLSAKLAKSLGLNLWVCCFVGLIPFVNLLGLLYLGRKASHALAAAGIKVGFLGTTLPENPPPGLPRTDHPA